MPTESSLIDADEKRVLPNGPAESIGDQYLTARGGTNLREEAVTVKGRAKKWSDVVDTFKDYIWREWKAAKTWNAEKGVRPTSHRFTEKASMDRYGRTLGADRAAQRLWGKSLTTVHVVRRARPFGENGQPQPPADHLADLLAGNSNVYRSYRRHIKENHGLTYARLSVVEPHQSGYAHLHDGLWVNDPENVIGETDIYPALDAHLRAVDQARPRNHGPDAVSVHQNPETESHPSDPEGSPPTTGLPREATEFLGGFAPHEKDVEREENAPNVLQSEKGPLRFYALLWARGVRQWRPDRTVFPHLVKASQDWYDNGGDIDTEYVTPEDIDVARDGGVSTVDVDARPITFKRFNAGDSGM
jgi:hypothetical protein